jgi:hypothetical protein
MLGLSNPLSWNYLNGVSCRPHYEIMSRFIRLFIKASCSALTKYPSNEIIDRINNSINKCLQFPLKKPLGTQLLKTFPALHGTRYSLRCSQEASTALCPESDYFSAHHSKIRIFHQSPMLIPLLPFMLHAILVGLIILIVFDEEYNLLSSHYVVCFSLLLSHHFLVQICSLASRCQIPIVSETKFHTRI